MYSPINTVIQHGSHAIHVTADTVRVVGYRDNDLRGSLWGKGGGMSNKLLVSGISLFTERVVGDMPWQV